MPLVSHLTPVPLVPDVIWGLPTLSVTTSSSWLPWVRVAMPLISHLTPVPQGVGNVKFRRYYSVLMRKAWLCVRNLTKRCLVRDKIERPPGEHLGVDKSVECDTGNLQCSVMVNWLTCRSSTLFPFSATNN